jgi:hypothetical protein
MWSGRTVDEDVGARKSIASACRAGQLRLQPVGFAACRACVAPLSIHICENIPLYRNSVSAYVSAILIRRKGRSYVVSNRGSGSGGRRRRRAREVGAGRDHPREVLTFVRTSGAGAYGQSAWSWLSLLQSSLAEVRRAQPGKAHRQFAGTREAKGKVGSRESAPYAVKHRAGKAGRFRLHLSSVVHCVCILIARRTSGCQPAPGLPCALSFSGREERQQDSGAKRREEAKARLQFKKARLQFKMSIGRDAHAPCSVIARSSCDEDSMGSG